MDILKISINVANNYLSPFYKCKFPLWQLLLMYFYKLLVKCLLLLEMVPGLMPKLTLRGPVFNVPLKKHLPLLAGRKITLLSQFALCISVIIAN